MRVILHPAAEQDIQEAAAFYEREGTPMVAARFVAEFKRLTAVLVEHPEIGSPRVNGRQWTADEYFSLHGYLSRQWQ